MINDYEREFFYITVIFARILCKLFGVEGGFMSYRFCIVLAPVFAILASSIHFGNSVDCFEGCENPFSFASTFVKYIQLFYIYIYNFVDLHTHWFPYKKNCFIWQWYRFFLWTCVRVHFGLFSFL